jgi:hypothetical protein
MQDRRVGSFAYDALPVLVHSYYEYANIVLPN